MGYFSKSFSAVKSAFRSSWNVVEKSAFGAAFLRGADIDIVGGPGKLIEPYAQSAWVNRAVRIKVDEIGSVPLKFYVGETEYNDASFLAWWRKPFIGPGGLPVGIKDVREQLASWPDLGGEFFVVLGDDWILPFASRNWQNLSRPFIARPDRMRHVVQSSRIIGWVFTDAGGQQHTLLPEQVIHSPVWTPYDDFRGLANVKVVFNAAEADYLAGLYVRNLMRNNGDQGVYVIAKGGQVSDSQKEQITAALREKRSKALRGDFAPMFLTGDVEIEDAKAQAPNGDLNNGRILNRHEIFIGLCVPPSMADVKASYSIGADSDRYTLITGACRALSGKVDEALTRIAEIMTGKSILAESDWDEHPVMQQVRRERIDSALKLWGVGMPIKQANDYLDLGMKPFAGWDQGYLPFSVAPVLADSPSTPDSPTAAAPSTDPILDPALGEDDSIKSLRLLALARSRSRQMVCQQLADQDKEFAAFTCTCAHGEGTAQKADRPPSELAHWKTLIAQRRTTVKNFQSAFGRVLMKARVQTLKNIESYHPDALKAKVTIEGVQQVVEFKAAAASFLFDLADFIISFHGAMENQQKAALQTAGQQFFDEIDKPDVFKYPPAKALEYLRARQNKLKGVPQDVFDRVKAQLEEGLNGGDTQAQLEKRVKSCFNDIAEGQAKTIALTETSAAYGNSRAESMKQAGVQYKRWLTSGNSNVRLAHAEANGQTVPVDEPFSVDGEDLMYPGDSNGSAGNVINCHCISVAKAGPAE